MNTKEEAAKVGKTLSRYAITHDYSVYQAAEDGFIAGAKYALNNQWISIKDKLPVIEKGMKYKNVFIHYLDGTICAGFYSDTFYDWGGNTLPSGIDYWMEIPKSERETT